MTIPSSPCGPVPHPSRSRVPSVFRRALAATIVLLATGGCDGLVDLPATPEAVEIIPSSIRSDAIPDTLEFTIRILDERGREIEGLSPTVATTNQNVIHVTGSNAVVTVGNGTATLRVVAGSIFASASVEVVQVPVEAEVVAGNGQQGEPGAPLPQPLVLELRDRLGTPAADVEVAFGVAAGDGIVDPEAMVTGANGTASATWTLGSTLGPQRVHAFPSEQPELITEFHAEGRATSLP